MYLINTFDVSTLLRKFIHCLELATCSCPGGQQDGPPAPDIIVAGGRTNTLHFSSIYVDHSFPYRCSLITLTAGHWNYLGLLENMDPGLIPEDSNFMVVGGPRAPPTVPNWYRMEARARVGWGGLHGHSVLGRFQMVPEMESPQIGSGSHKTERLDSSSIRDQVKILKPCQGG